MHPITQRPHLLVFITWLSYFSQSCHAILNSMYATYNCIAYTAIGAAQVCCHGECADGTTVDSPAGLCAYWLSPLYDPPQVPSCTSTQVWAYTISTSVITGGTCSTGCQWTSEQYNYKCCECPPGYVSDTTNYVESLQTTPRHYDFCFGCTDAGETLSYDSTTGTYSCQPSTQASSQTSSTTSSKTPAQTPSKSSSPTPSQTPIFQELCSAAPSLENSLTAFGNLDSWLGAACPTTSVLSAIEQLITDIYDLFEAIQPPKNGDTSAEFTAASAVIKTIGAFLLTAQFVTEGIPLAGISAAMGTIWETLCAVISYSGMATTGAKGGLWVLQHYGCPVSPGLTSRRSISAKASDSSSFALIRAYSERNVGYNPCVDLLSYFPTNYTTAALADTSCNQIELYDASATNDTTVAAAITGMQQFCSAYQGSGNSTMVMDLQNMLSAVAAAVPYCDTTQTSTSSSASGSLLTGTSSRPPSATAALSGSTTSLASGSLASGLSSLLPSSTTAPSNSMSALLIQTLSLSSASVESPSTSSISKQIPGSCSTSTISSSVGADLTQSTSVGSVLTATGAPGISSLSPSGPLSGSSVSSVLSSSTGRFPTTVSSSLVSAPSFAFPSLAIHATSIPRIWVTCMLISMTLVL